jgi:endonuclease IV
MDFMRLGVHVPIAGGVLKAVERAKRLGCATMQIFSRRNVATQHFFILETPKKTEAEDERNLATVRALSRS